MKYPGRKVLNATWLLLLLLLLSAPSRAQTPDGRQWGEAVEGVQMSVSAAGLVKAGVPALRVTFRNTRGEDLDLYLGIVGGWSPRPCDLEGRSLPCTLNFKLDLTDRKGGTRALIFKGISYVAGRLDAHVVRLRANSTYELELGLDQFYLPARGGYNFRPAPGRYRIVLEFESPGPDDAFARRLFEKKNLWRGKLRSNTLKIRV